MFLSKNTTSLPERLQKFIANGRAQAETMEAGVRRDGVMAKVRQAEAAIRLEGWLTSPGLRSPN